MNEPLINVGIVSAHEISFRLWGTYHASTHEGIDTGATGEQSVRASADGSIEWQGKTYAALQFIPADEAACHFELKDVTIGIGFHWEQREDQHFAGGLQFINTHDQLTAINRVKVEDYLLSVISSEMSATASVELLKAHAVISRSWLLSNVSARLQHLPDASPLLKQTALMHSLDQTSTPVCTTDETIKWYDREAHTLFDVCADDHCQRYQGLSRACTDRVRQAIAATRGQVLTHSGGICDARFSKCCGGVLEEFPYCWEEVDHPYLKATADCAEAMLSGSVSDSHRLPDLRRESEAEAWIRSTPDAFCHTTDRRILSQVLNRYDQRTADFYRWQVSYSQEELARLIRERSGADYGGIVDLIPLARGTSGRIWKLRIVGVKLTRTIGKELEIRRTLSPTHLYSSAFVVDKEGMLANGLPARFTLTGAGWGHGVGLCQIGAAVMGEQGYNYRDILLHYYRGARIEPLY